MLSIPELFEVLDKESTKEESKEDSKAELIDSPSPELKSMSISERGEFCFNLKIKGFRISQLATRYGVGQSTIYRWIKQYLDDFKHDFESQTKADLLMEELVFLEHLQEVGLYEMRQADYDSLDAKTGELVKVRTNESKMIKLQYLKAVMQIRKMRQDLMLSVGILPKQPEKIYHTMEQEKGILEKEKTSAADRDPEELKKDIQKLLRETRSLT